MHDLQSLGQGDARILIGGGDRRVRPSNNNYLNQVMKCPRCDSLNTKFCYYNNYNLSQPRHFCKSCRRYWTKGGLLRNVPVGGGCRKAKRSKPKPTTETAVTDTAAPPISNSNSSSDSSSLTATPPIAVIAELASFGLPESRFFVSPPQMMLKPIVDHNDHHHQHHQQQQLREDQQQWQLPKITTQDVANDEYEVNVNEIETGLTTQVDWQNGEGLFHELTGAVDQSYWSDQNQWSDHDHSLY